MVFLVSILLVQSSGENIPPNKWTFTDDYFTVYGGPEMVVSITGSPEYDRDETSTLLVQIMNQGKILGFESEDEPVGSNEIALSKIEQQQEYSVTTAVGIVASLSAGDAPVDIKTPPQSAGTLVSGQVSQPLPFEIKIWDSAPAGEYIMNNPNGGALAMLTTSRLVYAGSNDALNTEFYKHVFNKNAQGEYYRLGDMVRLTKSNTGSASSTNKRNFSLLGDPALSLAIPEWNVVTDSINSIEIEYENDSLISELDTIKALSKIRVCGYITDENGNKLTSVSGILYPTIFDKYKTITTLSNDGYAPLNYNIQKNIIYKGKASITNGRFEFSFIVPRDITYSYGLGKISYYMTSEINDSKGSFKDIVIGGSADSIE